MRNEFASVQTRFSVSGKHYTVAAELQQPIVERLNRRTAASSVDANEIFYCHTLVRKS